MRKGGEVHFEAAEDEDVLIDDNGGKLRVNSTKVYTIDVAANDPDITIPADQDAESSEDPHDIARLVVAGRMANFVGVINAIGAGPTITIPLEGGPVPFASSNLAMRGWDASAGASKMIDCQVDKDPNYDGTGEPRLQFSFVDGTEFAAGDFIYLGGAFVIEG